MEINHILFGAAYYDEYMPYERMDTDMDMMKQAGMNVIRIGESTWSTWEPADGVYDFTKLRHMLECSKKHGISVIVGTPTYAIPAWMAKKYPDILSITHSGKCMYGHRQNMDITHPKYLEYCENIIRRMLEITSEYEHVIGYQIDNETKPYDTCSPRAQNMFVSYLMEAFPDIEEFNRRFGLDYWSNRINTWDDFPDIRGTINGSLSAEYKKFQRKLVTDFHHWQANIIKEYKKPEQFITHNFDYEWRDYSHGLQPEVDQYAAASCMDIAGCDIYHPSQDKLTGAEIAFGGALAYSLKKTNYLVLETQAQGNPEWLPYKGQLRLQAYSHISSGSNSVMYWHWHSIHNAIESYWKGVLSHNLKENETYREAAVIGEEFHRIGAHICNLKKKNDVAILISNTSLIGLEEFPINKEWNYNDILRSLYDTFYRCNVECDLVSDTETDLFQYRLLVVPALYSASGQTIQALRDYVEQGGHLLMTYRSCFSDEYLKIYHEDAPYHLTDVFGCTYDQFTVPEQVGLENVSSPVLSESFQACGDSLSKAKALYWMELLTPISPSCEVWYRYSSHSFFGAYSAVTHHSYGKGTATYMGCQPDADTLFRIVTQLLTITNIPCEEHLFPVVHKKGINSQNHAVHFFLNYSPEEETFSYAGKAGTNLLTSERISSKNRCTLKPWDVMMIEEDI